MVAKASEREEIESYFMAEAESFRNKQPSITKKRRRKMKKIIKGAMGIFCLGVMIFFGYGSALGEDANIGLIMPMTGRVAAIGIDTLHGTEIAAKEINDAGGLKVAGKTYEVKIRSYNDEATAAKAVAGMQKLKDKYNVPVVLMGLSGPTMACLEQNERLGIIIMGFFKHPAATSGNKLVVRHTNTTAADSKNTAEAVGKVLNPKTYAMITNSDDWGKATVKGFQDAFQKLGIKEVASEWIDERSQTDFRGQLTKVRAANPDVILLTAHDEASAGVVKQAHELGIKTTFALSPGFGDTAVKLAGPELIEGYLKPLEFTSKTPWPPANARYRKELYPAMGYKEPAAAFGINMYGSIHIITRAMQMAGTTTDAKKIREAIPKVVPLPEKYNTTGVTAFLENGAPVMPSEIGRFHDGKLVAIKF